MVTARRRTNPPSRQEKKKQNASLQASHKTRLADGTKRTVLRGGVKLAANATQAGT